MKMLESVKKFVWTNLVVIVTLVLNLCFVLYLYLTKQLDWLEIGVSLWNMLVFWMSVYMVMFLPSSLLVSSKWFKKMCLKLYSNYFWVYEKSMKYDLSTNIYIFLVWYVGVGIEVWLMSVFMKMLWMWDYVSFDMAEMYMYFPKDSKVMFVVLMSLFMQMVLEMYSIVVMMMWFMMESMYIMMNFYDTSTLKDVMKASMMGYMLVFGFLFCLGGNFIVMYLLFFFLFFLCESMYHMMSYFVKSEKKYPYVEKSGLSMEDMVKEKKYESISWMEKKMIIYGHSFFCSLIMNGFFVVLKMKLYSKMSLEESLNSMKGSILVKPMEKQFDSGGFLKSFYFMKGESYSVFGLMKMVKLDSKNKNVDVMDMKSTLLSSYDFVEMFNYVKYYPWQKEEECKYVVLMGFDEKYLCWLEFNDFLNVSYYLSGVVDNKSDILCVYMYWTYNFKVSLTLLKHLFSFSSVNGYFKFNNVNSKVSMMESFVFFLCWCYWYSYLQDYLNNLEFEGIKLEEYYNYTNKYMYYMKSYYNFMVLPNQEVKEVWNKENYYMMEMYNMKNFWSKHMLLKDYAEVAKSFDVMVKEKLDKDKHMKKLLFACMSCNVDIDVWDEFLLWLEEKGLKKSGSEWTLECCPGEVELFFFKEMVKHFSNVNIMPWFKMDSEMMMDSNKGMEDMKLKSLK